MIYTANVIRNGQVVAELSRPGRPYGQAEANDYPGCVLTADGVEYAGPAEPTPDPVAMLPALDSARQAKWRAAREASANALLAEGWTLEQTMAAGAEFVNAYAALSFGYWYGGAAGATPQTNLLLAIQADTEREWLDLGSPTVREQMLEILQ